MVLPGTGWRITVDQPSLGDGFLTADEPAAIFGGRRTGDESPGYAAASCDPARCVTAVIQQLPRWAY
jgi:hypothetical protein